MKLLFTNKPRKLIPYVLLFVILLFAAVISVQAGVTNGLQVPPTSTPVPPSLAIKSGSDAGSIYLPVVANAQPTNMPPPGSDREFFISPSGDDGHSGASPNQAWATFEHAWTVLQPGDKLILLDGVYFQTVDPDVKGLPDAPITVRAQNDGQAIIDGQGVRRPVTLESHKTGYMIIEGIVARNSVRSVFTVTADHNILRRVSAYNANTDELAHGYSISQGAEYNLLEDCVASGTGRKMVVLYNSDHNTVRRCFADWREWDGRSGHCWPWGEGLEIYGTDNSIIENSISYGHTPRAGISLLAQASQTSNNNKILGSMSILSGMKEDGTPMTWPAERPQPTTATCVQNFEQWPSLLAGIRVGGSGTIHDNLLQDVFAWGSARYGLAFHRAGPSPSYNNNHVNRATVFSNGLANIARWGGVGSGAAQEELVEFASIENSYIENIWMGGSSFVTMEGEGARLTHRYVDGVLTDEPLWPWPMEDRIQAELGISVTELMTGIISQSP